MTISVLGLGELVYDHIFVSRQHRMYYYGSRGGGPVWNILAELASNHVQTYAVGVAGSDVFGELARDELCHLGVDVSGVKLVDNKRTRTIFELLKIPSGGCSLPKHTFRGTRCAVCNRDFADLSKSSFARLPAASHIGSIQLPDTDVLCIDRATKERLSVVREARRRGVVTVLDLGRVDWRYVPSIRILANLSHCDIVSTPESVAGGLLSRLRLDSYQDLIKVGRTSILCITKADRGLEIIVRGEKNRVVISQVPANRPDKYIDTAGAGDNFLARFLANLFKTRNPRRDCSVLRDVPSIRAAASTAIASLSDVLQAYGARGHLRSPREDIKPGFLSYRGHPVDSFAGRVRRLARCPFCGTPRERYAKSGTSSIKSVSRQNITSLLQRVLKSAERKKSIEDCMALMVKARSAYVVGTGGSFAAAHFIAQVLSTGCNAPMSVLRPYDYVRVGTKSDLLVVVTYSGSTYDCQLAIDHAKELGVGQIALITGTAAPRLESSLRPGTDKCIPHGEKASERGFVSIAGTVAPCALWTAAAAGSGPMAKLVMKLDSKENGTSEQAKKLGAALKGGKVIDVFGGAWSWPSMLDFESKLTEAGLGVAHLHESKDFSHGRFILTMKRERSKTPKTPKMMILVGDKDPYEKLLVRTLKELGPVVTLSTQTDGPVGALEVLIDIQVLVYEIAQFINPKLDISKPRPIPPEGLKLYKWRNKKPSSKHGTPGT